MNFRDRRLASASETDQQLSRDTGAQPRPSGPDTPDAIWTRLVRQIRGGEHDAAAHFADTYRRGARVLFRRYLGSIAIDALVDEAMAGAVEEIRRGWISDPSDLVHFLRGIVEREQAERRPGGSKKLQARPGEPDGVTEKANVRRKAVLIEAALQHFTRVERKALDRYYLKGEPLDAVLADAGITHEDFERLKLRLHRVASRTKQNQEPPGPLNAKVRAARRSV
jgi:DNA-directed RNA polymerase specialized sigma24 family protein